MKQIKYVISSRLMENANNDVVQFASEHDLYADIKKTMFRGEEYRMFDWVDVFEATHFDTFDEAKKVVDTMPFNHTIAKVEIIKGGVSK